MALGEEGPRVGNNLGCALADRELEFLLVGALYPNWVGLRSWVRLTELPVGAGEVLEPVYLVLRRWAQAVVLTGDRVAALLSGVDLPTAARALYKQAVLAGGGGPPGALRRLDRFRPRGEDFAPYRELLADHPTELERLWELTAFLRGETAQALRDLDPGRDLLTPWTLASGIEELAPGMPEVAPREGVAQAPRPGETDAASEVVREVLAGPRVLRRVDFSRVTEASLPEPSSASTATQDQDLGQATMDPREELTPPGDGLLRLNAAGPNSPGSGEQRLYHLSGYLRQLRVEGPEGVRTLDLSEHLKLPTRLAVSPRGDLWIADGETGRLLHLDDAGEPLGVLEGLPRDLGGLAVDRRGVLFLGDRRRGRVLVLGPDGKQLGELGGALENPLGQVSALAVAPSGESCWVLDQPGGRLVRLDRQGRALTEVGLRTTCTGVERPLALCIDGQAGCWLLDGATGRLVRFGPGGVRRQVLAPPEGARRIRSGTLARRRDGSLALLDLDRAEVLSWGPDLAPRGIVPGLAVPEDGQGYGADLEPGPGLRVLSSRATTAPRDGERKCARSI